MRRAGTDKKKNGANVTNNIFKPPPILKQIETTRPHHRSRTFSLVDVDVDVSLSFLPLPLHTSPALIDFFDLFTNLYLTVLDRT